MSISDARLDANRANAQHSTGPRQRKAKPNHPSTPSKPVSPAAPSCYLPTTPLIYQQHLDRNFAEFAPATDNENALVQTIADAEWRLLRIAPLEASIYAIGRLELADQFADHADPVNREALIQGKIFMTYRRDLINLALQERRLRNQRKTDLAELTQLQKDRAEKEKELSKKRHNQVQRALELNNKAIYHKVDLDLAGLGFDFSLYELLAYSQQNRKSKTPNRTDLDFDQWLTAFRAAQKEQKAA